MFVFQSRVIYCFYIYRRKQLFKLPNGEYASLGRTEAALNSDPHIEMSCVVTCPGKMSLVAIILPDKDACLTMWPQFEDDYKQPDSLNSKMGEVLEGPLAQDLMHHEVPKQYLVVRDLWTPESGLLTPSMKIKRHEIEKYYSHELEAIFRSLD